MAASTSIRRRFDPPIPQNMFVETEDYEKCLERVKEASVVIISGQCGLGKTWVAYQSLAMICKERKKKNPKMLGIYKMFKCTTPESLDESVSSFLADYGVPLPPQPPSVGSWQVLLHMFEELNETYSDYEKYFILTDTEAPADLLDVLNLFCEKLRDSPDLLLKWKLIVTTTNTNLLIHNFRHIKKENCLKMEGFSQENTKSLYKIATNNEVSEQSEIPSLLHNELGHLPLALKIAMKDLHTGSQPKNPAEYVKNYIRDMEAKTKELDPDNYKEAHKDCPTITIAACVLSMERCISDLPEPDMYRKLMRMLAFVNERNIPPELMKAFAETLTDPRSASRAVLMLMNKMEQRGLCNKSSETDSSDDEFFSVHELIKQAMKTYFKKDEKMKMTLLTNSLVAFTRVMSKDGRRHSPLLISYYLEHGLRLDEGINQLLPQPSPENRAHALIMFLHCDLLISIGYCLVSQGNIAEGEKRFVMALDKYSRLVCGMSYAELKDDSRLSEECEVALELYRKGQSSAMVHVDSLEFQRFIEKLPQYHRLTQNSLSDMLEVEEDSLVNGHLTDRGYNLYISKHASAQDCQARSAKVYMGELLAQIYVAQAKVCLRRDTCDIDAVEAHIEQCVAAQAIFDQLKTDHKVYLLQALITERTLLSCKLDKASCYSDVNAVYYGWKNLPKQPASETKAYECGLMKSYPAADKYHQLRCKEGELLSLGRLYKMARDEASNSSHPSCETYFENGRTLIAEIRQLIKPDMAATYSHRAMGASCRHFAKFLSDCGRFPSPIEIIIESLEELRLQSLPANVLDPVNVQYRQRYSALEEYYTKYKETSSDGGGKLLKASTPAVTMVKNIIKAIRKPETRQPDEDCSTHCLEEILTNDVEESEPERESVTREVTAVEQASSAS